MKALICILSLLLTCNAYAASSCKDAEPNKHHRKQHRVHYESVKYAYPIIYCDYKDDDRGQLYVTCHARDAHKCVTEYFYDNDRYHDC